LHYTKYLPFSSPGGTDDRFAISDGQGQGFFDNYVFAGFQTLDGLFGVQSVWRTNAGYFEFDVGGKK